jgi:signal transduction protein with GAF and PtsI domain
MQPLFDREVQAQQLHEVETTSAISLALTSFMDVDELLTLVMDKSKEVMQAEASSLLRLDQEAGLLRFHVTRGTAEARLHSATVALGHGIAGWVAQLASTLVRSSLVTLAPRPIWTTPSWAIM